MARYRGPVSRLCRREGMKLYLKGSKCYTKKCPFERRGTPPGQHGIRRRKMSNYGIQLREKQKLRRIYGLLESGGPAAVIGATGHGGGMGGGLYPYPLIEDGDFGALPGGGFEIGGVLAGAGGVVKAGRLGMTIAPNPLAGGFATVRFSLPKAGPATVSVFDAIGRRVHQRQLLARRNGAVTVDMRHMSAGVYLVRFEADDFTATRKLVVQQ